MKTCRCFGKWTCSSSGEFSLRMYRAYRGKQIRRCFFFLECSIICYGVIIHKWLINDLGVLIIHKWLINDSWWIPIFFGCSPDDSLFHIFFITKLLQKIKETYGIIIKTIIFSYLIISEIQHVKICRPYRTSKMWNLCLVVLFFCWGDLVGP